MLAFALVAALAVAGGAGQVRATLEGDISYTVYQDPPAGSVLQVGSTLTFRVDVTSGAPAGGFPGPVVFDLKKPADFSFASFGLQAGNIVTSCTDNSPAWGYVRCTVGNGGSTASVSNSSAAEVVLNFMAGAAAAGGVYSDATVRALFADAGSGFRNAGDAADGVSTGGGENDTLDASAGGVTVTNILGPNANITVSTGASPGAVFEGSLAAVTVSFAHALGSFGAAVQPVDVEVTNGDVQSGSVVCPGGGAGSVVAGNARCSASTVTNGSAMTFMVRARDTAAGDDMTFTVVAPSLGLSQAEAASSGQGVATRTVSVDEVGLETVSVPGPTGASPPWLPGAAISVCTSAVASDSADDRAAGAAQSPGGVAGTSTLSAVAPMAGGDFTVAGPGGPVAFTYLDAGAANCGANQSGLRFTPATSGSYAVTAHYNGDMASGATRAATYGTNSLVLAVQTANPIPAVSSLSPSSAAAGGPGFTLTVNGSGFVAGSTVRWAGADRPTTF
ncbi:MAG: hypothetical protein IT429_06250, partial [Gemmataceae bacterium]|nr:hypothetical protein [Gemmataceae bacterium]